ncbi:hypothetical protein C479_07513 [Halovivax asiaticus JCM 14624]|uniref:Uncharacterized protein n=1 Tax=Halovivax asiaticus JCM 14624 TaxID=1227490 RepID=M0BLG1_9EURY|nr:hypothetical protein [Halovivax asiaticus]ELZ11138.1 hypothetical protein C479_07513 [Halovivax asiaticus JCM 14624]
MSQKRTLRTLVRPHEAFDGWTPGLRVVAVLVVLVCAVNGASIALAGEAVADQVEESHPVGLSSDVTQSIETDVSNALDSVTQRAALAPLAWVFMIAGLAVLVAGRAGTDDGAVRDAFRDGLGIAALAAVPGLLRYAVRPGVVERSLAGWGYMDPYAQSRYEPPMAAISPYAQSLYEPPMAAISQLFPDGSLWMVVVAVSGVLTAAIVYGGMTASFEMGRSRAALVAAVAFVTTTVSAVLEVGGWIGAPIGFGLPFVVAGIVGLLGAYTYITVSKRLVGFGGGEEAPPQPQYVGLHRAGALVALTLGFVLLDGLAVL